MKISGTFLDEITHDIPSQNWGKRQWSEDFDAMKAIGIDTVILIRAGYQDRCTFDSPTLQRHQAMQPAYGDLVQLFLEEAEQRQMAFFFGIYDSGRFWVNGEHQQEIDLNKAFCDEVIERYGHSSAFKGWYICHEINAFDDCAMKVYEGLSRHLRGLKDIPILVSPYIKGIKQFGAQALALNQHIDTWEKVFSRIQGLVDIVAFQDGNVDFRDLAAYLEANRTLAERHGIQSWSNVETFDRDMPIKFPPIDFRKLRHKMEQATRAEVDKLITFEFSHFMSPNSAYPAARQLYDRYSEWLQETKQ